MHLSWTRIPDPEDPHSEVMVPFVPAEYEARVQGKHEWLEQLQEHRGHKSFKTTQDPQRRTLGFTCECSGELQTFDIEIVSLKRMHRVQRERAQKIFEAESRRGNKARKRKANRALAQSRALLYRYLTKKQKWDLRARKGFFITGKDGNTYEIQAAGINNVLRYDAQGKAQYRFCVVSKEHIPAYDLMLAQKLVLETNPRNFLDISVIQDLTTGETWNNGKHIDNLEFETEGRTPEPTWPGFRTPDDAEHQQYEAIREREEKKPHVTDLLMHDMCMSETAKYNTMPILGTSIGFVLTADEDVLPSYDHQIELPPLDDQDTEGRIIKLITGIPAVTYRSVAHVLKHFDLHDLFGRHVLLHSETDAEWCARERPVWHKEPSILGVKKILDDRVPKGKAWWVADAETVGMVAYWDEDPKQGYGIFNLDGVVIYEPPHDEESLQAQEIEDREVHLPALEEARQARLKIPVPNILIKSVHVGR